MENYPLNPKSKIFRWGPAPGKYYYESDFVDAIFEVFPNLYKGYQWPKTLFLFKENRMLWMNEFAEVRKDGAKIFNAFMLKRTERLRFWKQWKQILKKLHAFESTFARLELKSLNDSEFHTLGLDFYKILIPFWISTLPAELGNYGADYVLEEKLKKVVKNRQEVPRLMEVLTAPEEPSFYQEEEMDLAGTKSLKDHQKQYFWLKNSYNGTQVLPVSFFQKRKKVLPKSLAKEVLEKVRQTKFKKARAKKQFRLSQDIMDTATALSIGVAWQDQRKGEIFRYLHFKELYLQEAARRKKVNPESLKVLGTRELVEGIYRDSFMPIVSRRKGPFGFFLEKNKVEELLRKTATKYWNLYGQDKISGKQEKIEGIVASKGKITVVKGKVKIVLDPFKRGNFQKGDILVAPMTTPEYVFLMKHASAIVTDAGGLTSHAAIVSRELNIPCIVGTRVATQVLKDGDRIEVDANKGIVRKL